MEIAFCFFSLAESTAFCMKGFWGIGTNLWTLHLGLNHKKVCIKLKVYMSCRVVRIFMF
uniref:Uncharacterized protein n=1 Tax=Rhizophora mucronata TaxID=61149 RepID=A0A2P2QVN6_RHIMU